MLRLNKLAIADKIRNASYDATISQVYIQVERIFSAPVHFHYTDHSISHSERVLNRIEELIDAYAEIDFSLNDVERVILVCATLLHDIGMQTSKYNESLGEMPLDEKALEEIRENHHIYSERWIHDSSTLGGDFNLGLQLLSDHIIELIAMVAKYHRKLPIGDLKDEYVLTELVRIPLLVALLRLGDSLDIGRDRVNMEIISRVNIPRKSKFIWFCHHYVTGIIIEKNKRIGIIFRFPREYETLIAKDGSTFTVEIEKCVKKEANKSYNEVYELLFNSGIKLPRDVEYNFSGFSPFAKRMPDDVESFIKGERFQSNLPKENINFSGRNNYLSEITERFKSESLLQIKAPGGFGKSQLAIKYAYDNMGDFEYIWIVNAASKDTLVADYRDFATRIIKMPDAESAELIMVIKVVKEWLGKSKNFLFIFENVEELIDENNKNIIAEFFPKKFEGRILINTRERLDIPGAICELGIFSKDEAIKFLKTRIEKIKYNPSISINDNVILEIAELLGNLPLALEYAVAYMLATEDTPEMYLDSLKKDEFIGSVAGWINIDEYNRFAIKAVWDITFNRLKTVDVLAFHLFNLCAYCAPDDIPLSLFIKGRKYLPPSLCAIINEKRRRDEIIVTLKKFSLITSRLIGSGDTTLSMHRLIQEAVRSKFNKDNPKKVKDSTECVDCKVCEDCENWPLRCLDVARTVYKFDDCNNASITEYLRYSPHVIAIAKYAEKFIGNGKRSDVQEKSAWLYNQIGEGFYWGARFEDAIDIFKQSLNIRKNILCEDHSDIADSYNNIGKVHASLGDYDEAFEMFKKASEINKKSELREDRNTAITCNNLGGNYYCRKQYKEALYYYREALKITKETSFHDLTATACHNIAGVYNEIGDYERAFRWYEVALRLRIEIHGEEHKNTASTYNNMGVVLFNLSKFEEALDMYNIALGIHERLNEKHPSVAISHNNIATVCSAKGDYTSATESYNCATEMLSYWVAQKNLKSIVENNLGKII